MAYKRRVNIVSARVTRNGTTLRLDRDARRVWVGVPGSRRSSRRGTVCFPFVYSVGRCVRSLFDAERYEDAGFEIGFEPAAIGFSVEKTLSYMRRSYLSTGDRIVPPGPPVRQIAIERAEDGELPGLSPVQAARFRAVDFDLTLTDALEIQVAAIEGSPGIPTTTLVQVVARSGTVCYVKAIHCDARGYDAALRAILLALRLLDGRRLPERTILRVHHLPTWLLLAGASAPPTNTSQGLVRSARRRLKASRTEFDLVLGSIEPQIELRATVERGVAESREIVPARYEPDVSDDERVRLEIGLWNHST